MLATLTRKPFNHPDWLFEVKWDGYRAIAEIKKGKVSFYSRNQISLNKKYPAIVDSLKKLRVDAVLDGEIVAVNDKGLPDFQMLQNYQKTGKGRLLYYAFDLLYFKGHDITGISLIKRKELLKKILLSSKNVKFSGHVSKNGILFYKAVKKKGLEGIMAKHSQSKYQINKRSKKWLKIKTRLTQEAVIAGFTEPRGGRKHFGSLVLGVYEKNKLIYIGHCGGGFTSKKINAIYSKLKPLIRKKCPFKEAPETNTPVAWVMPKLVCEVAFHGWTEDGIMRQPVFSHLRDDKPPLEAVREI